jgi:hypothetical protein
VLYRQSGVLDKDSEANSSYYNPHVRDLSVVYLKFDIRKVEQSSYNMHDEAEALESVPGEETAPGLNAIAIATAGGNGVLTTAETGDYVIEGFEVRCSSLVTGSLAI